MEACCESCASHAASGQATQEYALRCLKSIEAMLARLTPPSHAYSNSFFVDESGVSVVVPVTTARIWVMSYVLVAAGAVTVAWGGGNDQSFRTFLSAEGPSAGNLPLAANGGVSANAGAWPNYLFATDPGEALCLNTNGTQAIGGHVSYFVGDPFLLSA